MKPKYLIEVKKAKTIKWYWWYLIRMRANGKILLTPNETFKSKAHAVKMARMFEQDLKGSKVVIE